MESNESKVGGKKVGIIVAALTALPATLLVGLAFYVGTADPNFVAATGIARCDAVKETILDDGDLYWGGLDYTRERLEDYKSKIESLCPNEYAQLESEFKSTIRRACESKKWNQNHEIAKAKVECGANVKDHFAIVGNAVQMREGVFFLATISSVTVDSHTYHGVSGYVLKVVLRDTEENQFFFNRYSSKEDVDSDYKALISAMAGINPTLLCRGSRTE